MTSYLRNWRNYAVFAGRTTRGGFWLFVFVNTVIATVLFQIDEWAGLTFAAGGYGVISSAFLLVALLPTVSALCRRLHDTGLTGVWLLLWFVPLVGGLALFALSLRSGQRGQNAYGPDSRAVKGVEIPDDGGLPFSYPKGRFVACPWCGGSNPIGESRCQWCYKPYREPGVSADVGSRCDA